MSQTAHIPSRRKPRRTASTWILRTGVAGGVLSTFAVTGAAASANAAEPAQKTVEMPAVAAAVASASAQSTAATAQAAADYEYRSEIRTEQAQAALTAKKSAAKKADAIAERKAEAQRKAAAAAAAAERASRSAARTTLSGTGSAASIVSFLQAQVGKAYVMGATGPSAYDCSSLTQAAFKTAGIDLPRVSQDQSTEGTSVSLDSLRTGDLVFWGEPGNAYHVAVYVGGGEYIDAANPEKGVVKQTLDYNPPDFAQRVL